MVQVHPFAAQHAFVYRMIFISFNCYAVVRIFAYHNTTTHTTVTAGSGITCCCV
jgi:hypothetical protein